MSVKFSEFMFHSLDTVVDLLATISHYSIKTYQLKTRQIC